MIEIVATGPLATVQDRGRARWAALGVPRSGAFDRSSAALANRLVGNPFEAAVLEVTFGGLAVRAVDAVTVACTGAVCPGPAWGVATTLPASAVLRLGTPASGLRSYLAVRGGISTGTELGSRSTDLLSGLGPARLRPGLRLPVGPQPTTLPSDALAPPVPTGRVLDVLIGPRADWFTDGALERLARQPWTVRGESDRVGMRLDGPPLVRARHGELPSEPTLPGAVQVPADGRPIVFGPDAPVTGGYPVIAVLTDAALDLAAQCRPGDDVRFRVLRRRITSGSGREPPI